MSEFKPGSFSIVVAGTRLLSAVEANCPPEAEFDVKDVEHERIDPSAVLAGIRSMEVKRLSALTVHGQLSNPQLSEEKLARLNLYAISTLDT
mgnify:CR=1 FL=1